jgi:hypothetical protein
MLNYLSNIPLVNLKRTADDPQKKNYYFSGIFLLPFFWPLLLISLIFVNLLRAILFGLFLVLFTLAMVFIRKPFWLVWLEKIAAKIGGRLLDVNTALIEFTFGKSPSIG